MKKTTIAAPEQVSKFEQLKAKKLIPPEQYDELKKVMKKLGYDDFLSLEQGEITIKFLKGENVFGVLPTSGGKSFTFQTVARMTDGLTVVVSPLIALMKDQVAKHRDGASLYFNSDLTPFQKKDVKRRIREGKVRLLYVSPERFKSEGFKKLLNSSSQYVKRFVIDEAHCVIEWGYGFRVKYLHIAQEIEAFEERLGENIPVLLLTATASPWLQRETAKKLRVHIPSKNYILQDKGADRPELKIESKLLRNDKTKIKWLVKQFAKGGAFHKKRGIVFSAYAEGGETKDAYNAPKLHQELQKSGVKKIDYYYGQMDLDKRKGIQNKFEKGDLDILIATKAFGMGIDLPRLEFTVHFYPPVSLEEYWQEAGRGGRGMNVNKNERCDCVVLHTPEDRDRLNSFTLSTGFAKILSTFTCVTQDIVCFDVKEVKARGRLRELLERLREKKDIKRLKNMRISQTTFEVWKLLRPANTVLKHVRSILKDEGIKNSRQTDRLQSNLKIRAARKGKIIRVNRRLNHYVSELNWFTEAEVEALEMLDDGRVDKVIHSQFKILKADLSLKEIKTVATRINALRINIKKKYDYVHDHFLKAKPGKEKDVLLKYILHG